MGFPPVDIDANDADVAAMLRVQSGDDLALNELMDRWQRPLTSYLLRLTGDHTTACDLAEETFVQVYQSRSRYRPTGAFSTWLFAIASNLFRNFARWRRRHRTESMDLTTDADSKPLSEKVHDASPQPAEAAEITERSHAVRTAVLSLPDDQRQAIVLFEYEGLSHGEIARVMSCTPKSVEARLYRARAALRDKLRKWLE
jgi:RNA polymerase sigma-70 factor (ECF subfamily)